MTIFITIALAIVFILLRRTTRAPLFRGSIGENRVSRILSTLPENYHLIDNVIIPSQTGTTQIDHVVVSPYGIFVIETKNYTGWVFGSENSYHWKETFRTTGRTFFRNPVKQNWAHVYALAELLELDKNVFIPVVVFSDSSSLGVQSSVPVIYMSQLKDFVLCHQQEILSIEEVERIAERVYRANLTGDGNEALHIQGVKDNIERKEEAMRYGICPLCGGRIVLRNGRYGQFYGCSDYPSCKITHSL